MRKKPGKSRLKRFGLEPKKYAQGGMVHATSKLMESAGRMMGSEKAKMIERAEREMSDGPKDKTRRRKQLDEQIEAAGG